MGDNKLKVAILGKLPSKFNAPFNDKSWQIWGSNFHKDFYLLPRYDLWFDIHNSNLGRFKHQLLKLIPPEKFITQKNYPYKEAVELVGGKYFTNVTAYMIVYAILKGATEIAMYGCLFEKADEIRKEQRNNVRELLFFAKGRGIKVTSIESELLEEWELYE